MANFRRIGFGQVEENQLSYFHTGQMFASLPLDKSVQVLQNGEFMFYNYADGYVKAEGKGEPMLVLNEIKVYEDYLANKDFAMVRVGDNYVTNPSAVGRITTVSIETDGANKGNASNPYAGGSLTIGIDADPAHTEYGYRMEGIAPRVVKTNIGDVMTTNMVPVGVEYTKGDFLVPTKTTTSVVNRTTGETVNQDTLVLTKVSSMPTTGMVWQVAQVYTMPDMQDGLKIQRIQ